MKKQRKLVSLALIAALLITVGVNTPDEGGLVHTTRSAASGAIDNNNAKIKELQDKADKIAKANKEREGKINSLRGDIAQQAELIRQVDEQIKQIEAQIKAYSELMEAKQELIDRLEDEIGQKEKEIANTENRIVQKDAEIARLEVENNENIQKFGQLIAQMYMNTGGDNMGILTGSSGFSEMFLQVEVIRNIGEKNAEMMLSLLDSIQRQTDAKLDLEDAKVQLQTEQEQMEQQQSDYGDEKHRLQTERAAVAAEVERQYSVLYELAKEREELQASVGQINQQVSSDAKELEKLYKQIKELEEENKRIEAAIKAGQDPNEIYSGDGFRWPLDSKYRLITCDYGCWCYTPPRTGAHNGIDVGNGGIKGANVYAMDKGKVLIALNGTTGYGVYVVIDHGSGISTLYAHMISGSLKVKPGDIVSKGDVIGSVGSTGMSTGPHLHFEVRINGTTVNPWKNGVPRP